MKARPILFSGPMIRALLEGRKTQTRRAVKGAALDWLDGARFDSSFVADPANAMCPYGQPGDLLWVRETWQLHSRATDFAKVVYRASEAASHTEFHELIPTSLIGEMQPKPFQEGWRSSIHMLRWASRLTLELTGVRVERLQDIGYCDALAEGVEPLPVRPVPEGMSFEESNRLSGEEAFRPIWEAINGPGSWAVNPWVWVLEFRVHQQNVDALLKVRAA